MASRLYEDLGIGQSSYSKHSIDEYNEYGDETEGEYEEEEVNGIESDSKSDELACPFCPDDFDVLGLCCHIDADHRMEVKPGICPICATKVGINMASHVITQHESILKALCNKKHFSTRSRSAIILLRKDLQDKFLRIIKDSPLSSPSNVAADSMLMSFVHNPEPTHKPQTDVVVSPTEVSSSSKSSNDSSSERVSQSEATNKCEFVQGLMWSMMLDDL